MGSARYTVRPARRDELSAILAVQRHAFTRVAVAAGIDPQHLEPLCERLDDLARHFDAGTVFVVAVDETGSVVGSVRGSLDGDVALVNRLVVDDGWERRGVGNALMDVLETELAHARLFRLFTGSDASGPLALYEKRGYLPVGREDRGHFQLVWLEKRGAEAVS